MTSPEHEDLVGKVLAGVYVLEEVIATGSMSTIYRATNRRLDQQVAVKLLFGSFTANAALKARFEAEAKVQAKLNHPHILRVSDFVSDKGSFAIVMELVEGTALDQILYDIGGPMDPRRVRALMLPVLDAVSYAHSQGIVHRDIKPSNIIVTRVGKTEFPKVMDFGIAKILAEGSSTTAPGAMLGTLLFMSPEQCKALKSVDERADIYAIGVTLYQMTTGMVPFYAESAFEIMLAHVQTPPTPPKELLPGFPDALQAVILRALAKDPEDRFQSVSELAAALDALSLGAEGQSETAEAGLPTDGEAEVRVVGDDASSHVANREEVSASFISRDNMTVPSLDASLGTRAVRPRTLEGLPQVGTPVQSMGSEASDSKLRRGRQDKVVKGSEPRFEEEQSPKQSPKSRSNHLVDRPFASSTSPRDRNPARARPRRTASALSPRATSSPQASRGGGLERVPSVLSPGDDLTHAKSLHVRVATKEDWGRYYDPNIAGGGIFCPSNDPPKVGTSVRVEITFVSGPRLFVRGIATWRRPKLNDPRARAGVGVQVHPSERSKLAYVNHWVKGQADDKRALRRLPVKLQVAYSGRAGRRVNFTRDLNEEGIFVRSRELLELGTPIELVLKPPGSKRKPLSLRGVVSRLVDDIDDRGMGISLRFSDAKKETVYANLVEELEASFLRGDLPEENL